MSVPIVDLNGEAPGAALVEALRVASCAWLTGHGIPIELQAAMRAESLAFFDLPRERKASVEWGGEGLWRGWQPVHEGGAEYGGDERPTELLERFEVNTLAGEPAPQTRWPDEPSDFRTTWSTYLAHVHRLANDLTLLLADELELPSADLPAWTERQFSNLVANYYPPQPQAPEVGRIRVNPHIDHGGFTLLMLDDAPGGLEAETPTGWQPVPNVSGAILVQGGELLSAWTEQGLSANRHRVVNPPPEQALTRRLSVIWFHHPDLTWRLASGETAGEVVRRRQEAYRGAA